jgi:hypothetical protein
MKYIATDMDYDNDPEPVSDRDPAMEYMFPDSNPMLNRFENHLKQFNPNERTV